MRWLLVLGCLVLPLPVSAQITGAGGIWSGITPPSTCSKGNVFASISTGTLSICSATDVWTELAAGGGAAWGGITGTLSTQTDLQTTLNGKQASGTYATGTGTANGTNTGDQSSVSGNAGTATTLQTPRTINGVSFNGSANVTVPAAGSTLSDNVPVSKLNSGTGASATTFWRGDATWQTPAGGGGPSSVVTTQTTTNATLSYANITGLVFNVAAGTRYRISCVIPYTADATTTGLGISWVGPASPTLTRGQATNGITAATVGGTLIVGNDTGGVTTASNPVGNTSIFEGIWSNGANAGTIQMRVKSEVAIANAITVAVGAVCSYAVY